MTSAVAVRPVLRAHLFADPVAGPRRRAVVLAVLTGAAGGGFVAWRQPGSALDNPWAEDGTVFLAQAYRHPLSHLLFVRYAGYPAVYPRLVAALAAQLGVRAAPVVLALGGAAACAVAVFVVIVASEGHVSSLPLRVLLGAGVALFPAAGIEIAAATCNAQWYLITAAPWCLLWRGRSVAAGVGAGVLLALAAGSDPLVGVLLPLAALRVVALGRSRDQLPVVGLLIGLAVQLPAVVRPDLVAPRVRPSALDLVGSWIWRGPTEALLGPQLARYLGLAGAVGALVVTAAAVAMCAVAGGPRRVWVATGALALSATMFTVTARLRWTPGFSIRAAMSDGSRYDLAPSLLCLTVLVLALDALLARSRRKEASPVGTGRTGDRLLPVGASVLLGLGLVAASVGGLTLSNTRGPSWSAQLPAARAACTLNPGRAGSVVPLVGAPPWEGRILVPCTALRSS